MQSSWRDGQPASPCGSGMVRRFCVWSRAAGPHFLGKNCQELLGWVLERCTGTRIPASCSRTGVWLLLWHRNHSRVLECSIWRKGCLGRDGISGMLQGRSGDHGNTVSISRSPSPLLLILDKQTHAIYILTSFPVPNGTGRIKQLLFYIPPCPMNPEGEAVFLSLELWKHEKNEFKFSVLGSCSLTVQISTASINSISSADPGVINIGESLAWSTLAASGRF